MRKKHFLIFNLLISLTMISTGCGLLPEPSTLIQAPKYVHATTEVDEDKTLLAKKYLPNGTELAQPNGPVGATGVVAGDIDGDNIDELVVIYHAKSNAAQAGYFILKKQTDNEWQKVYSKKGSGYDISWANIVDVTGDGKNEVLLGWQIGVSAGNMLEVSSWENNELNLISKVNYSEIEIIYLEEQPVPRLAIWNKNFADVYDVQVLKWGNSDFIEDVENYPSYFTKVSDYYKKRIEEIPDASYYWYYLAEGYLNAREPELALWAINRGLLLKTTIPSYEEFTDLKIKIEEQVLAENRTMIPYDIKNANVMLEIPSDLLPYLEIEEQIRNDFSYTVSFIHSKDNSKQLLFSIEVDYKEIPSDGKSLELVEETDHLNYYINRGEHNLVNEQESIEKMITSMKVGTQTSSYKSVEEEMVLSSVREAFLTYNYVMSGGKMPTGIIDTFTYNNMDYRYLGSDLDTNEELSEYMGELYTSDSIQSFMKRVNMIESKGKLAYPNADIGSMSNYDRATIEYSKDNGLEKEFYIRVPLGNSLAYKIVQIIFEKTNNGWKISSEPGSF
ncbi:hypothetical protein HNQ94_002960 [Salirhabdus euzebyi]|uniref:Uncharacterized protein n=1 Tax=Salirhabdus euzebyi TaxID=394506 RepID=A0A841Q7V1_9BACI|nr:DL-endopeptidase inhibitor IseA family protein [Salirhabdus euzebyi]MBB6454478.1 hypothetical protein [Salirhabdus euzebyi]